MPFLTHVRRLKSLLLLALIIALIAGAYLIGRHSVPISTRPLAVFGAFSIDRESGNYGLFIDNLDNDYFLTADANVKHILEAYLASVEVPGHPPTVQDYGLDSVYYYDDRSFIIGEKGDPRDAAANAYVMHSIQDGGKIADCDIFADTGLYKDENIMLSASVQNDGPSNNGICLYERGAANFRFIDLSPKLSATETIFPNSLGHSRWATITNIDLLHRTLRAAVYDVRSIGADGNYRYARSVEVSI